MNTATDLTMNQPELKFPKDAKVEGLSSQKDHQKLLDYLMARLCDGEQQRYSNIDRYGTIDKLVSTWQMLSPADSKRAAKQDRTGEAQVTKLNLPLIHSHVEDMVAFFAGVFSPPSGAFFQMPVAGKSADGTALMQLMNRHARINGDYKQLCRMLRSLLKYNVGGFRVEWESPNELDNGEDKQLNRVRSIDMYNYMYDRSISEPSMIPTTAEWAASFDVVSHVHLMRLVRKRVYTGCDNLIQQNQEGDSSAMTARFFRYPPTYAGVDYADGRTTDGDEMDWASWFGDIKSESINIPGHERIDMYCWLNPDQFNLITTREVPSGGDFRLFRFTIIDCKYIVKIEEVDKDLDDSEMSVIPHYLDFMNQDDLASAQRSVVELMKPFQTYGSFLLNSHVAAARGSIYGIKFYDKSMFNLDELEAGATAGYVPSKMAGRDVRQGIYEAQTTVPRDGVIQEVMRLLELMRQFFPSQGAPSQIAGIDRAVKSQVASVMQGINRKMHMIVQILDSSIMGPSNWKRYENLADYGDFTSQLTDDEVIDLLGTGLQQLNREQAEEALRELIVTFLQSPDTAKQYDISKLMDQWGSLLNIGLDLSAFKIQQQQPQQPPQQPQQEGVPNAAGGGNPLLAGLG